MLLLRMLMFSRIQENLPLRLNRVETDTCPIMILLLAKEMHSFIQYKKYELVNEDISGGDSARVPPPHNTIYFILHWVY